MSIDKVHFFLDEADEWRWHRRAPNGEIVADSGEGYKDIRDAISGAVRVNGNEVEYINPKEESPEKEWEGMANE